MVARSVDLASMDASREQPAPGLSGDDWLASVTSPSTEAPSGREARRGAVVSALRSNRPALAATVFLGLLIVASVLAPVLAPHDPLQQDLSSIMHGPSGSHWLGTDDLGRDVLSRLLVGSRVSLAGATLATAVALLLGVPVGLIGGAVGGWVDGLLMRVVDTLLSFPAIVLAVGVIGAMGPGFRNAMFAMGLVFAPVLARLMRGQVLAVRGETYIEAARSFGSSGRWITLRHILPNAIQPVLVQTTLIFALALLAEASLSFLGLGVGPPDPSWGAMLGRAYRYLQKAPLQVMAPGLAIMFTVLALNILGDGLRSALDPRARRR